MTLLQAVVLGAVQGITEFLPVSSTAHLILVPRVFGWRLDAGDPSVLAFNVLVQLGTLAAVVAYFRRDLASIARAALRGLRDGRPLGTPEARLGWWILLATVPAAALAIAFQGFFEAIESRPPMVAWILLGATVLLFAGERVGRRERALGTLTVSDALFVGAAQALALFPGVSRSAATIVGGLLRGFDRPAAARFSFLLSIPLLAAAGAVKAVDLARSEDARSHVPALAAGFVTAAVVGYASIHWLLGYLARRPLTAFAWYRIVVGTVLMAMALAHRL